MVTVSLTSKEHPDLGADLMELLWFRTGGAKFISTSRERVIWEIALRAPMSGSADTQAGVSRICRQAGFAQGHGAVPSARQIIS